MSIDDTQKIDMPATEMEHPPAVSRRTLMKTAAGVGVVAAAVGLVGVASASPSPYSETAGQTPDASSVDGPVVLHLSDLKSGTVEVFTASARTQITDHDLAARIARAAQH